MKRIKLIICFLGLLIIIQACGTNTIVHNAKEKEANEIVSLLLSNDISASKVKQEGRDLVFNIEVSGNFESALTILNQNNYPRNEIKTYSEVFSQGGIIPTASQEKAKMLMALEGEIEDMLLDVDKVKSAKVNLNMPEESALRAGDAPPPSSASVVLVHSEGFKNPEFKIQKIVANSVENLKFSNVELLYSKSGAKEITGSKNGSFQGDVIPGFNKKNFLALVSVITILLCLIIIYLVISLSSTKRSFKRLQEQIIEARAKKQGSLPS